MRFYTALAACVLVVFSSFYPTWSFAHSVNAQQELVITDLRVIEDSSRTTGCGPWTFCGLMTALAGPAQNPSTFTLNWLNTWKSAPNMNGYRLPPRNKMQTFVTTPWPKKADGSLDLTRAPFRLLAIVHRPDLNEGRFVFCATDQYGNKQDFTVIFEYNLSTNHMSRADWIYNWHILGSMTPGSSQYNSQLQYLTDKFARTPEMFDRIGLRSLRISDGWIAWQSQEWTDWDMRQFLLSWGPNFTLQQDLMTQTPHSTFNYGYNTVYVRDYVNANAQYILAGNHGMGNPLRSGGDDTAGQAWDNTGIYDPQARFLFSMATCTGCHFWETFNLSMNFHIAPRNAGQEAPLSNFWGTTSLMDGRATYRVHNEMGRRVTLFAQLLQQYGFCYSYNAAWTSGGSAAPSSAPASAGVAGATNPIPARVH